MQAGWEHRAAGGGEVGWARMLPVMKDDGRGRSFTRDIPSRRWKLQFGLLIARVLSHRLRSKHGPAVLGAMQHRSPPNASALALPNADSSLQHSANSPRRQM